jgi:hypothetical protein
MKRALLVLSLLAAAPAFGQEWKEIDCSKLERKIEGEPKYRTKTQGYALFVLDAEGKFLVWFVTDGDDLYVANKKIECVKKATSDSVMRTWKIGDMPVPGTSIVHTNLEVRTRLDDNPFISFSMKWAGKDTVYAGNDMTSQTDRTRWGKSPAEAPVLRPCPLGPLEFSFCSPTTLKTGEATTLVLGAGHRGSGLNAFSQVNDEFFEAGKDRIFATLIAKDDKGEEVKVKAEITEHC